MKCKPSKLPIGWLDIKIHFPQSAKLSIPVYSEWTSKCLNEFFKKSSADKWLLCFMNSFISFCLNVFLIYRITKPGSLLYKPGFRLFIIVSISINGVFSIWIFSIFLKIRIRLNSDSKCNQICNLKRNNYWMMNSPFYRSTLYKQLKMNPFFDC